MLNVEGRTFSTLNFIADMVLVNLLFLLTSLPIVTIGASYCAMHRVVMRLSNKEEGYIFRDYFREFAANFKKGTVLWLIMLVPIVVMAWNVYAIVSNPSVFPGWIVGFTGIGSFLVLMVLEYILPLQANFENGIFRTIRNAFSLMIMNLPRSILLLLIHLLPAMAAAISYTAILVILFCGATLPEYLCCMQLKKIFSKIS